MSILAVAKLLIKVDVAIKRVLADRAFKRSDALRIKNAKSVADAHARRTRALNAALVAHEAEGKLIDDKDKAAYRTCESLDLHGSRCKALAHNNIQALEQLV